MSYLSTEYLRVVTRRRMKERNIIELCPENRYKLQMVNSKKS